jgi:hypothetical protein
MQPLAQMSGAKNRPAAGSEPLHQAALLRAEWYLTCAEALRCILADRQADMPTPEFTACNYILTYDVIDVQFSCQKGYGHSCGNAWVRPGPQAGRL